MFKVGAWDFSDLKEDTSFPQEVASAISTLIHEGTVGGSVKPIKFLAEQVVNGVNYAVLVKTTSLTAKGSIEHLGIMTFNQQGIGSEAVYTLNEIKTIL